MPISRFKYCLHDDDDNDKLQHRHPPMRKQDPPAAPGNEKKNLHLVKARRKSVSVGGTLANEVILFFVCLYMCQQVRVYCCYEDFAILNL